LEAQLIDLADEVAYNTADLDDGYAASLFTAEDVAAGVPLYRDVFESVETQFPGATERERFHEGLRQLIDLLVSGLIEGTVAAAEASGIGESEEVRTFPRRLASFTEDVAGASRDLKRFLMERVYASPALGDERKQSQAQIAALFDWFLEDPARLPESYTERAADGAPHRVICDYIAGMTDAFFRRTYEHALGGASRPIS
jgi:dGTPase